jgi:hypothetical protein
MKVIKLTATARAYIESKPIEVVLGSDVRQPNKILSDTELWTKSLTEPTEIPALGPRPDGTLILYQDCLYVVRGQFTSAQQRLLVLEAADKERQLFERLKAKFDSPGGNAGTRARHRIPEAVRIEVWRRDQGKCATPGCGSRENLEYDHIIPIDGGGSNTARNIELLCEACNRRKSNKIQ